MRRLAFDRLAEAIAPDGALMLGAGETVIGQTDRFVSDPDCRGLYMPRRGAAGRRVGARRPGAPERRAVDDRLDAPRFWRAKGAWTRSSTAPRPISTSATCRSRCSCSIIPAWQDAASAIARLRDPEARVSCHYLVAEDGQVLRLVAEEKRAWHAGRSYWRGMQRRERGQHRHRDRQSGPRIRLSALSRRSRWTR